MSWLKLPHQTQAEASWCVPACAAIVTAFWQDPLMQEDLARWLGTTAIGTPVSRTQRLTQRGLRVTYGTGSLAELEAWLAQGIPPLLFVRTGEMAYWAIDTPHAVVLAGLEAMQAYLFDPAWEKAPQRVSVEELLLAWSHFDYAYAVLQLGG